MNTIAEKSVNAGTFVTKNELDALTTAYKQQRWAENSERIGMADSLTMWLSVEMMEEFLTTVKANGGNGIRCHFGVHTEAHSQPEFVGRQTVVLVGTRSKDGSYATAKQLLVENNGQPDVVALTGPVCPPFCGGAGTVGKSTLIVRGDNGMEII
jgi:hypothetical protein